MHSYYVDQQSYNFVRESTALWLPLDRIIQGCMIEILQNRSHLIVKALCAIKTCLLECRALIIRSTSVSTTCSRSQDDDDVRVEDLPSTWCLLRGEHCTCTYSSVQFDLVALSSVMADRQLQSGSTTVIQRRPKFMCYRKCV